MLADLSDLFNNDKFLVRTASCILFDAETQLALVVEFGICLTFVAHFYVLVVNLCSCFVATALCARISVLVSLLRFCALAFVQFVLKSIFGACKLVIFWILYRVFFVGVY